MAQPPAIRHFFVDEAGDLTLFNKRGASLVGGEGVSRLFMFGVVLLPEPVGAEKRLTELRRALLDDPYFAGVPSMSPAARKTTLCFHAKDDVAEVRREVFKLLPEFGAVVQVVIRRKVDLIVEARALHRRGLKLRPDDVYDDMVRRAFKDLSTDEAIDRIMFARRGKSDRLNALTRALSQKEAGEKVYAAAAAMTEDQIRKVVELMSVTPTNGPGPSLLSAAFPHESAGLQIVDYYLWALQRLYERGEDRFFNLLAPGYRLIVDLDDKRNSPAGEWYSTSHPLTLNKIMPVTS